MTTRSDKVCVTCLRLMPDIWFRRNAYNNCDYSAAAKEECSECFSRRTRKQMGLPFRENNDYPVDIGVH